MYKQLVKENMQVGSAHFHSQRQRYSFKWLTNDLEGANNEKLDTKSVQAFDGKLCQKYMRQSVIESIKRRNQYINKKYEVVFTCFISDSSDKQCV